MKRKTLLERNAILQSMSVQLEEHYERYGGGIIMFSWGYFRIQ